MPRFKVKGVLDRSAASDLWKRTLSHIPTTFGRLAYLASLRDPNSGLYRHHGLSTVFGRDESTKALRESHEQVFVEWIHLSLEKQHLDLSQFLAEINEPTVAVIDHWLKSRAYQANIPTSAQELERELFCKNLESLLDMIRSEAEASGQASSRLA